MVKKFQKQSNRSTKVNVWRGAKKERQGGKIVRYGAEQVRHGIKVCWKFLNVNNIHFKKSGGL